jgi:membrane protein
LARVGRGTLPNVGTRLAAWKPTLHSVKTRIRQDRVSVSAGSLAYHGFFAFFPAVIAALGVLTLVHVGAGTLHHLTHGIAKALPAGAAGVFEAAVRAATSRHEGSATAVVLGGIVALWSATSATAVLQQVLDVAYGVSTDRKFVARRIRGLPLLALTGVLGGLAAALVVFGEPIGSAISGAFPYDVASFTVGWTVFRWVIAFASISILFSAYYAFGPNREMVRWRWVTPGSLLATAVFLVGSLGFSFYVSTFGSYAKTYGSFAGVAIFIFWLYITSLAVLAGGEMNAELEREGKLGVPAARPSPPETAARAPEEALVPEGAHTTTDTARASEPAEGAHGVPGPVPDAPLARQSSSAEPDGRSRPAAN